MPRLSSKTAIVTGGAGVSGEPLLKHSWRKVLLFSHADEAMTRETFHPELHGNCDVSSSESSKNISRTAKEQFGKIDILVNNAGIQIEKTVADTSDEDWDSLMGSMPGACS
ncbi:MAG: hypothetical protein Ct9H300mP28_06670 [Pseudomonadota bacterium]|nr:MAG: hypothetical protein Ct9H300mP28_06670 [Pseudomonadota bacterium]